ncbi:carbonic anhydrase [Notoacmeibacter sp. MSK16QG-6]|uniref:carbonic anhydrase n=1 Tax=Notoacmeibacter sp. MSK16QG-6 TaxID=2957982 RepID=UPI0020A14895|nr:carbonic anhydrase [Notoacmeibacter sp. MSK16QG-6]MCP1199239.1 carbonic anhydrase [Notoacmeibacter sp. MSK16QG-6]
MGHLPDHLAQGYAAFMRGRFSFETERYRKLAEEGQKPSTLVIACCDSRAAPEVIFNSAPGEIFVIRNVANLVPPYAPDDDYHSTSAALEFAVQALRVQHILVMGHGRCGGIAAKLNPSEPLSPGDFIGKWIGLLEEPAEQVRARAIEDETERQTALERTAVKHSIRNLRTFPCVDQLEKRGKLSLHGGWFDISTGELWTLNTGSGEFEKQMDAS